MYPPIPPMIPPAYPQAAQLNQPKKKKPKEYSEEIQTALKTIIDEFEKEDQSVRERQIRLWKRLQLMWNGFTQIYWSEVAHDWRIADNELNAENDDHNYYDKNINIFKAYLESIIAAMSATVPAVKCKPDDADSVNDVLTAKGGTKIAELIYQHNDAPLLWMKALFIYCTQGMIAAWNYVDEDKKYGQVKVGEYEDQTEMVDKPYCPNCGKQLEGLDLENQIKQEWAESGEFDPSLDSNLYSQDSGTVCENCDQAVMPQMQKEPLIVTRLVGETHQAKSRQTIIVEGGLYIKVPNYARCQEDCPYLSYNYETHYSNIYKRFPKLRAQDKDIRSSGGYSGGNEMYERWGRLSPQYYGEYPADTPTVREWWLRPSAFEVINDDDVRKQLLKEFPNGAHCTFINDNYACAEDQSLDDCWTLTYNPLSEYIHFDPLGLMITSIQEITSDLVSLTLQTIEHGIPQTFADPSVLNFEAYRKMEVMPGAIFPAKPKSGKSISDGFYEVKTATLSGEIMPFAEKVQEMGQFLSGAMPSVFGGDASNSSRTASQYAMSRSQALQRLQTPWKMLTFWWKDVFGKVIPAYIKTMIDDEKLVKQNGENWINVVIKKSEMDGKIGSVELEAADDLPITTAQVKDIIMQLFQINNPEIIATLASPENLPLLAQAIGLNDFHIPGEDDREKQLEEIQLLIKAVPIPNINPMTGMEDDQSSIQPELMVDDHGVEGQVCKDWCVGPAGRQCKIDNPDGYKNVLLHLQAHLMAAQQLEMMFASPMQGNEQEQGNGGNSNAEKPPKATVRGDANKAETGQSASVH